MTGFKHDSAGFLVGELLDVNRELLDAQGASMSVWRGIRSDVRAIARSLGVEMRTSGGRSGSNGAGPARDASGRYVRRVDAPAGRSGSSGGRGTSVGARQAGTPRTAASTAERTSTGTATAGGRSNRTRGVGAGGAASPEDVNSRDALGRFSAGQGHAGASDKGESNMTGRLTDAIGRLGDSLDGADQIDPTITALKEVRDVVSPLGRGLFSMFGRGAERKKEVWYKRLLRAITGKKAAEAGGGVAGDVQSGSFMGTMTGEMLPMLMKYALPVLTAIGGVILAGLSLLGGVKLGEFIYKWLTDSGLMSKLFDAADSIKKSFSDVADWVKGKYDGAKEVVKTAVSDFQKGSQEKTDPVKYAPPVLDQSGRNANDPRRTDRAEAVRSDGRMINDPRRLDAAPLDELPPATSMAQRAGRFAGGVKNFFKTGSSQQRAFETGGSYSAGNIGGLSDAQTRALVASTAMTESSGGKLGVVNSAGYMGRYQAGAGWLADAGLINGGAKNVTAAMRKDGFTNEYKWGESGKMTEFLKNDKNWTGNLNYQKYLSSADTQDTAFKTNSDAAYKALMADPNIKDKSPESMAGLLKARHISGLGGARTVGSSNATGPVDSNGTSARKYFDDVAKDKSGFLGAYTSGATVTAGAARIPPVVIPSATPDRIAPAPSAAVPEKLNTTKQAPIKVSMRETIGQDVGDRGIAHVVSGGLGMMP